MDFTRRCGRCFNEFSELGYILCCGDFLCFPCDKIHPNLQTCPLCMKPIPARINLSIKQNIPEEVSLKLDDSTDIMEKLHGTMEFQVKNYKRIIKGLLNELALSQKNVHNLKEQNKRLKSAAANAEAFIGNNEINRPTTASSTSSRQSFGSVLPTHRGSTNVPPHNQPQSPLPFQNSRLLTPTVFASQTPPQQSNLRYYDESVVRRDHTDQESMLTSRKRLQPTYDNEMYSIHDNRSETEALTYKEDKLPTVPSVSLNTDYHSSQHQRERTLPQQLQRPPSTGSVNSVLSVISTKSAPVDKRSFSSSSNSSSANDRNQAGAMSPRATTTEYKHNNVRVRSPYPSTVLKAPQVKAVAVSQKQHQQQYDQLMHQHQVSSNKTDMSVYQQQQRQVPSPSLPLGVVNRLASPNWIGRPPTPQPKN